MYTENHMRSSWLNEHERNVVSSFKGKLHLLVFKKTPICFYSAVTSIRVTLMGTNISPPNVCLSRWFSKLAHVGCLIYPFPGGYRVGDGTQPITILPTTVHNDHVTLLGCNPKDKNIHHCKNMAVPDTTRFQGMKLCVGIYRVYTNKYIYIVRTVSNKHIWALVEKVDLQTHFISW